MLGNRFLTCPAHQVLSYVNLGSFLQVGNFTWNFFGFRNPSGWEERVSFTLQTNRIQRASYKQTPLSCFTLRRVGWDWWGKLGLNSPYGNALKRLDHSRAIQFVAVFPLQQKNCAKICLTSAHSQPFSGCTKWKNFSMAPLFLLWLLLGQKLHSPKEAVSDAIKGWSEASGLHRISLWLCARFSRFGFTIHLSWSQQRPWHHDFDRWLGF